ncbi:MAG: imidazole glycerol phosphate synthase cyclase subunit [Arcobacter sp.]|nr:MAG: imidazole glycerol phosphate synthase cyclase subunit [Arcobacter sp.]
MVKKRLVATLIIKNGIVVQSIGFKKYLPIGSPIIAVEFLNNWGIDEIIILDIDATPQKLPLKLELYKELSKKSFVPISIGGGIKKIQDIQSLIHHGADKICISSEAIHKPNFIQEAVNIFGSQCIIVCLNIKKDAQENYKLCLGKDPLEMDPFDFALQIQELGAGEILINNIDKDGDKEGYDISLMQKFASLLSIPVIALGGVGRPEHFDELLISSEVSALAAANFFHFFEHSVTITKSYLEKNQVDRIRLDSHFNYKDSNHDESQRLLKKEDEILSNMLFEFHEKELI